MCARAVACGPVGSGHTAGEVGLGAAGGPLSLGWPLARHALCIATVPKTKGAVFPKKNQRGRGLERMQTLTRKSKTNSLVCCWLNISAIPYTAHKTTSSYNSLAIRLAKSRSKNALNNPSFAPSEPCQVHPHISIGHATSFFLEDVIEPGVSPCAHSVLSHLTSLLQVGFE